MPISGKYDFQGISKLGGAGLRAAFSALPYVGPIAKLPLMGTVFEFLANLLANKGLIILNVGAIYVGGEIDQSLLDRSIEAGLKQVENPNITLTEEQKKEIDDAVIKAADKALPYGAAKPRP